MQRYRSADLNPGVGYELVRWQKKVFRGRAFADAPRSIVLRAVARTEPAVIFTLMGERYAAEVRADSNDDQLLIMTLPDPRRIRFRIGKISDVDVLRLFNLFLGPVEDENRLRAPEHLDDLSVRDRRKVDLDRCASRNGRSVGIHLCDQRHHNRRSTHRADGASGYVEKVAARLLRRRHGRHFFGPLLRLANSSARGWSPGPKSRGGGGGPVAAALEKAGQRVGGVLLAPLP